MKPLSTTVLVNALSGLRTNEASCSSPEAHATLTQALASRQAAPVIAAANLIAEYKLRGWGDALRSAFHELAGEKASTLDPGALAKEALVTALDVLDASEPALFAEAALFVNRERNRAPLRDSAARLRARGLLALARVAHPDFLIVAGAGLADADPTVRLAAAQAIGVRGHRDGAGLLLLRLSVANDSQELFVECLHGLFAIAPEFASRFARAALRDPREEARERIVHALGAAPDDSAVDLLASELPRHALTDARQPFIDALGLSVRPRARTLLLDLVSGERESDAEAALQALAIHRYDQRLCADLATRTAHDDDLAQRFRELFERSV